MIKRRQYAALPFRRTADGRIEIALLTSRDTGRWVIPKGWPIAGLSPSDSAAQEASEEGGFVGEVWSESMGAFEYQKRTADGIVPCLVDLFLLNVSGLLDEFPEKGQRRVRWFAPDDAAKEVAEEDLAALIRRVPSLVW